jgi:Na+/H+ antiporter NhaD/arsenite permease-like protein
MIIALLSIYFLLDAFHYKKEQPVPRGIKGSTKKIWVDGLINLIFLAGIIAMVLISGLVNLGPFSFWGIEYQRINLIRDVFLIFMGLMSLWTTPQSIREDNEFTWVPIREVAYIFLGLFITMVPCMLILKAGDKGALSVVTSFIKEPFHYFWACGILSSFLDNAPTYMAFFCSILGQFYPGIPEGVSVPRLLNDHAVFLKAISCGAVFMGANTYIGNAPNFMVRSIAEESGVTMPSFFGYIFNYSLPILCPLFFVLGLIFF